ncbi:MAG: sugar kinase, partial [Armatimonadetes bacterium]|nr:sugar kinase [Armatimonadota bacterium]
MPELLSLGECMIEFFAEEPLDAAEAFRRAYGGDTFNMLTAAARLGTRSGFVTRVAEDAFGRYLLNAWEREGINTGYVRRGGSFNGVYFIATREDGEREFTYYRRGSSAAQLEPSDLDGIAFAQIRAFHTSGITQALSDSARATAREGLKRAKAAGCLASYDLNFRSRLWSAEDAREALE